jgi:hypothetical protein
MPVPTAISGWSDSQRDKANRLYEELHTVRAVALAMKVSHRTASKLISRQASKYEATPEKIENLRRAWQRDHSRASYQALLKHDREWILSRKYRNQMSGLLPIPVERDEELASAIRAALSKMKDKGVRIRLYELSRELGFRLGLPNGIVHRSSELTTNVLRINFEAGCIPPGQIAVPLKPRKYLREGILGEALFAE